MKIRMGVRLTIAVSVDPALVDTPFPPLLIQTLVENAIKHGIEPKVGPAVLTVTVKVLPDKQHLSISVQDNGIGLQQSPATKGSGMGLNNIRERLRLLYGSKASLSVNGALEGGVISDIKVPLLQRIIQYESVLGFELKPKVALCVDEAMGSIWFLGDDPSLEVRQSIAYKLRNVAESCAVAMSSEKARLAAQLRALTERQLKLAQRLEMPVATARACVAKSATPTEFRNCISKVLRNPPDETDWGYWMVLYERKTPT
jgi:hypothetical protein